MNYIFILFFFLYLRVTPESTRTYPLFPDTTRFRSPQVAAEGAKACGERAPAVLHCARRAKAFLNRQSWPIATASQSNEYGRRIAPPRCKNPARSELTVN